MSRARGTRVTDAATEVVRYRFRAYPNAKQASAFARLFGCVRVVYNDALAYCRAEHAAGRGFPSDIQTQVLTRAKSTEQRAWLNQVYGVCLVQAVNDAKTAYRNFFDSVNGKRAGRRVGLPRMKSRHDHYDSARFTSAARFTVETDPVDASVGWLALPKMYGRLRFAASRALPSTPTSVTVIREPDGRYYVSFVVTRPIERNPTPTGRGVGVDVGLSSYAHTVSVDTTTGEEIETARIETPAYLRRRARALARSQRAFSRTQKGSRNRDKARHRVAVAHRKVREARLNHAHQQAARLVAAHDTIVVESLDLTTMVKARSLSKSVADQGLGQFLALVEEKAVRAGKRFVKVSRRYPSTQLCSTCGTKTGPRGRHELGVRSWTCGTLPGRGTGCGAVHDRDVNAARNIYTEGLRILATTHVADGRSETLNACRGTRRRTTARPSPHAPVKQEEAREISPSPG